MSNTTPRPARAFMLGAALFLALASGALAHLKVTKTAPEKDQTLKEPVKAVRIWFTEDPDVALSQLRLMGPQGEVSLEHMHSMGDKDLMASVTDALAPGKYTVKWRTAGDDGHVQRGEWSFEVAPPGENP